MMARRNTPTLLLAFFGSLLALAGCEAPPAPTPDGGSVCGDDRDCDDGLFCTGTERCMPGAADRKSVV